MTELRGQKRRHVLLLLLGLIGCSRPLSVQGPSGWLSQAAPATAVPVIIIAILLAFITVLVIAVGTNFVR